MRVVKWFYKYLYRVFVPLWYGLTMAITGIREHSEISAYATPEGIAAALKWGRHWRPDPLKGNFDVLMHPRKMQERIYRGAEGFGDCDDHAMYWCTALLTNGLADRAWFSTVWYTAVDGSSTGHCVCVYEKAGEVRWTDYGDPRPYEGRWGWAEQVAQDSRRTLQAAGMIEVKLRRKGSPKFMFRGVRTMTT